MHVCDRKQADRTGKSKFRIFIAYYKFKKFFTLDMLAFAYVVDSNPLWYGKAHAGFTVKNRNNPVS